MLQALNQLQMEHSQMPPMARLGMDLHTEIKLKPRQGLRGKNTTIPQLVIHGTPRKAMGGTRMPQKLEAS